MKELTNKLLIGLLILTALLHFYRLNFPNAYVFDEVYHAFTAKEYLKGNKAAWDPFATPPPGVAYEWLHPPVAKEVMTISMWLLHSTDAWAWRLPGATLGIVAVWLVYLLGLQLLKNKQTALLAAFLFSLDGLNFVQSRTGMNDIYLVTFILSSTLMFTKNKYFLSSLLMGLALASKWPGIFLLPIFGLLLLLNRQLKYLAYFIIVPAIIYLVSYTPYFLQGYDFNNFIELHKQIWAYQTNLKATHTYSSPWWSWPLDLVPVWYYVSYLPGKMANIFAAGNPVLFWLGDTALILTIYQAIKLKSKQLLIILLGFATFWLPWAISPRIMFLYHFSPSVPFLALALAYQLNNIYQSKQRLLFFTLLGFVILGFILIYPFITGVYLPKQAITLFFSFNLAKNPF